MHEKRLNIVVCEDNRGDVYLLREAFNNEGLKYRFLEYQDGESMLRYVEKLEKDGEPCPDIVLLDLNLPRVDGADVLERIRKSPHCAGVPVVIISSSDSPKDHELAVRLGAATYFRKPADYDEFMRIGPIVRAVVTKGANA